MLGVQAMYTQRLARYEPAHGLILDVHHLVMRGKELHLVAVWIAETDKERVPLTAPRVVNRIFTNLAVVNVTGSGLIVREMVEGSSLAELHCRDPGRSSAVDLSCTSADAPGAQTRTMSQPERLRSARRRSETQF